MKSFAALCILTTIVSAWSASLTAEQTEKVKEFFTTCLDSTKADKEIVEKARHGDFSTDEHLDEFFTCMFKKAGFMDDNGHLIPDAIKAQVPNGIESADVEKVFTACKKVQDEPKGKVAKSAYKCYLTETPIKIHLFGES